MAKNEYAIGDHKEKHSHHGPMGGGPGGPPMGAPGQKAKNFQKTIKQLVTYCSIYIPYILFALVLALVGAAFNVYGPDQLSEMTDIIQEGLMTTIDLDTIQRVGIILGLCVQLYTRVYYGYGYKKNYEKNAYGFIRKNKPHSVKLF